MVPRGGLSHALHNTSKINGLPLSKMDSLYHVNVPMSTGRTAL
jgi:hypothetical protein